MDHNEQLNNYVSSTGASLVMQYSVSYCRQDRKGRYYGYFPALR